MPLVVYADFKCILKKSESKSGNTQITHIHEPRSVGYYVKCSFDDNLSRYNSYQGTDPTQWFSQELFTLAEEVQALHEDQKPTNLTPEKDETFRDASRCHICEQSLDCRIRVRDHYHLTGRFHGAAHEECNLHYQDLRIIPIIFHNLNAYDSHLIIKQILTCVDGRIDLLPLTMERYVSFTKHIVSSKLTRRFIDSFRFMASSLEKLASYLDPDKKTIVKRGFAHLDEGRFKLLMKKAVFPYDYLESWAKLDEVALPPTEAFYSAINNSDISA